jgi:hypothetical protein
MNARLLLTSLLTLLGLAWAWAGEPQKASGDRTRPNSL